MESKEKISRMSSKCAMSTLERTAVIVGLSYIVAVAVQLMALSPLAISEAFTSSVVSSSRSVWNAR